MFSESLQIFLITEILQILLVIGDMHLIISDLGYWTNIFFVIIKYYEKENKVDLLDCILLIVWPCLKVKIRRNQGGHFHNLFLTSQIDFARDEASRRY